MKQILSFIKTYVILVILFVVQKPLFLLLEKSSTAPQTINIWDYMPQVIWHGLSLDLGMAGYLSGIPGLLLLVSIWIRKKLVYPILNIYFGIVAFMNVAADEAALTENEIRTGFRADGIEDGGNRFTAGFRREGIAVIAVDVSRHFVCGIFFRKHGVERVIGFFGRGEFTGEDLLHHLFGNAEHIVGGQTDIDLVLFDIGFQVIQFRQEFQGDIFIVRDHVFPVGDLFQTVLTQHGV